MARASWTVSAPGKLMVLGEHAVLHGRQCIVAAVDQRLSVRLDARDDDRVRVQSALGDHETTLGELADGANCRFVMAALRESRELLGGGLDVTIDAGFSNKVGLGSSAAVTAATLAACQAMRGEPLNPAALLVAGLRVIDAVQGGGSGADLAASIHGGVLLYRREPRLATRLADTFPLTVVYSGVKVSTVEVMAQVKALRQRHASVFDHLYDAIEATVIAGARAIEERDWRRFGELMTIAAGLMDALGVSTPDLTLRLHHLRQTTGIYGAKLSGAGLGDCLIGLGTGTPPPSAGEPLPLTVSPIGVRIES